MWSFPHVCTSSLFASQLPRHRGSSHRLILLTSRERAKLFPYSYLQLPLLNECVHAVAWCVWLGWVCRPGSDFGGRLAVYWQHTVRSWLRQFLSRQVETGPQSLGFTAIKVSRCHGYFDFASFSKYLRPCLSIDSPAISGPKTLRQLIVQSYEHVHFTLQALSETDCWKVAGFLDSLAPVQKSIAAVTEIKSSFQTHYVEATLQHYKAQDAKHPFPMFEWHGAPLENLERILSHGFALTPVPISGRVYGNGIYFAMHQAFETSRKYALPAPDGHRHILLCQIYAR